MGSTLTDAEVGLQGGGLSDADVGLGAAPAGGALSDADVGLTPPGQRRAQPGSWSYILQGAVAPWESLFRMGTGMAGQTAGALVGGVEAIPELLQGQGQAAADIVKGRMAAGGEKLTPSKTVFAPTATFDEYLGRLFENIRSGLGDVAEVTETARGKVAGAIAPKAVQDLVKERPEAARTLAEYVFDAAAALSPLGLLRRAPRRGR